MLKKSLPPKRMWCTMWATLAQLSCLPAAERQVQWCSARLAANLLKSTLATKTENPQGLNQNEQAVKPKTSLQFAAELMGSQKQWVFKKKKKKKLQKGRSYISYKAGNAFCISRWASVAGLLEILPSAHAGAHLMPIRTNKRCLIFHFLLLPHCWELLLFSSSFCFSCGESHF